MKYKFLLLLLTGTFLVATSHILADKNDHISRDDSSSRQGSRGHQGSSHESKGQEKSGSSPRHDSRGDQGSRQESRARGGSESHSSPSFQGDRGLRSTKHVQRSAGPSPTKQIHSSDRRGHNRSGGERRSTFQQGSFSNRSPSLSRSYNRGDIQRKTEGFDRPDRRRVFDQNKVLKHSHDFKSGFSDRRKHFHDASQRYSHYVKNRYPGYRTWFNDGYYNRHRNRPIYWNNSINWWGGAPWSGVYSWLGWGASAYPYYYYDGYPTQMDSTWPGYADEIASPYSTASIQGDWLPLGVFTLGANITEASTSDIFIQLAINRNGDLSGIYYNVTTDQSYPVQGYVDANTQEALWQVPGQSRAPKMIAGIYNLTQDVTSVQLEFPGGIVQNWFLIRISE